MPLVDIVFGPRRDVRSIRPSIVDMDTVREMAARAKAEVDAVDLPNNGPAEVVYRKRANAGFIGERVPAEEIDSLSAFDRNTLQVEIQRGPAQANISFHYGVGTAIHAHAEGQPGWGMHLQRELEEIILDNGQPIWRPIRFAHLLPLVCAAAFVALWVWLLAVTVLPLPAVILGWVVNGGVVAAAVRWSRRLLQLERVRQVAHRIRTETRAETNARRIDARANLKVAVVTAALALPIGFALAALTNAFGLAA